MALRSNLQPQLMPIQDKITREVIKRNLLIPIHYYMTEGLEVKQNYAPQHLLGLLSHLGEWKRMEIRITVFPEEILLEHLVLQSLVFLSHHWKISESNVVAQIISAVFNKYSHFTLLFGKKLSNPFSGQDLGNDKDEELGQDYPYVFFLNHAIRSKLEFGGRRFVDVRLFNPLGSRPSPVNKAACLGEKYLMLALLQSGAKLNNITNQRSWVAGLILKLLSNVARDGAMEIMKGKNDDGMLKKFKTNPEMVCARLLVRALPPMQKRYLQYGTNNFCKASFPDPIELIRAVSDSGLLPMLKYRFVEPSHLRHLCRVIIRKQLHIDFHLPEGIRELKLPILVKNYLNLYED